MEDIIMDLGSRYTPVSPLLEVYSVTITKFNNETARRSEVYGSICVCDGKGNNVTFYDRDLQHSESINPHETLSLTGSPIPALTGFTINLDLKLRDENQNHVLSCGRICWNKIMQSYNNKFLSLNVEGPQGFATVHFAVYDVALLAKVEVFIRQKCEQDVDGDNSNKFPSNVDFYGSIVAYSSRISHECRSDCKNFFRTTLFRRSVGNRLRLEADKPIPLLRSFVIVPAGAPVVVEAKLFRGDSKDVFLNGVTSEFVARKDYKSFIDGEGFIAEVHVRRRRAPKDHFE